MKSDHGNCLKLISVNGLCPVASPSLCRVSREVNHPGFGKTDSFGVTIRMPFGTQYSLGIRPPSLAFDDQTLQNERGVRPDVQWIFVVTITRQATPNATEAVAGSGKL